MRGGDRSLPSQSVYGRGSQAVKQLRVHLGTDERRVFSTPSGLRSILKVTVGKEGMTINLALVCLKMKGIESSCTVLSTSIRLAL